MLGLKWNFEKIGKAPNGNFPRGSSHLFLFLFSFFFFFFFYLFLPVSPLSLPSPSLQLRCYPQQAPTTSPSPFLVSLSLYLPPSPRVLIDQHLRSLIELQALAGWAQTAMILWQVAWWWPRWRGGAEANMHSGSGELRLGLTIRVHGSCSGQPVYGMTRLAWTRTRTRHDY